ncbi:MerR family transcriptional regulator [Pseudonocardiaceae bacterium YIM PH 21723]|nr:MerR family transcriptional regulator [Pseudonocardiaceae bacterium YIM PH 21723]
MEYTISEVSRRFGIAVSALRYYDEIGLLRPTGRARAVRTYGRDELERLALIQVLHRDGLMTLNDTATALSARIDNGRSVARQALHRSLDRVRDQMRRLREAEALLEHMLSCPAEEPIEGCPILAAQLEIAVEGALGAA